MRGVDAKGGGPYPPGMIAPGAIAVLAQIGGMLPASPTSTVDGAPVGRYVKDVLRVGSYTHPRDGWELVVDEAMLDGLADTFARMTRDGIEIEVTRDHESTAEAVLGYARAAYRLGDTLYMACEIRGMAGIDLVNVVKNVSVEIAEDYTDGRGRKYGLAIFRVSVVQQPIVPGQGEFVRAGMGAQPLPVFRFASGGTIPGGAAPAGGVRWLSESREARPMGIQIKALASALALLGLSAADLTEENVVERITALAGTAKTKADADAKDAAAKLSALEAQIATMKASAVPAVPTPALMEAIEERAETLESQIDGMVGGSIAVTQETAAALKASLIGTPGARPVLLLSRGADAAKAAPARAIVETLRKAHRAAVAGGGSKTGGQPMSMSHAGAGDAGAPDAAGVEAETAKYLRLINGTPTK